MNAESLGKKLDNKYKVGYRYRVISLGRRGPVPK
jgi:hypothetical protein